jgi:hypothetical protein
MLDSAYNYFAQLLYPILPNVRMNSLARETLNITFQRTDKHKRKFFVIRPCLLDMVFVVGEWRLWTFML